MSDSDTLQRFEKTTFTHDGETRDVYRAGEGPGVIVIHEMPGLTPRVAAFGQRLVDAGYAVAMPVLFGTPGRPPSVPYLASQMMRGCVAREFTSWATKTPSPVTKWLRGLATDLHEAQGGPGVGVVGMCFTGGFGLAMMVDEVVVAPVLSQPSLPLAVGKRRSADLGVTDDELARIRARAEQGACVMGLRFTNDRAVPAARFDRLREELGDNFIAVEIDSAPGNPHNIRKAAHSVLTEDLVETEGHPTLEALERVMSFLEERLR